MLICAIWSSMSHSQRSLAHKKISSKSPHGTSAFEQADARGTPEPKVQQPRQTRPEQQWSRMLPPLTWRPSGHRRVRSGGPHCQSAGPARQPEKSYHTLQHTRATSHMRKGCAEHFHHQVICAHRNQVLVHTPAHLRLMMCSSTMAKAPASLHVAMQKHDAAYLRV